MHHHISKLMLLFAAIMTAIIFGMMSYGLYQEDVPGMAFFVLMFGVPLLFLILRRLIHEIKLDVISETPTPGAAFDAAVFWEKMDTNNVALTQNPGRLLFKNGELQLMSKKVTVFSIPLEEIKTYLLGGIGGDYSFSITNGSNEYSIRIPDTTNPSTIKEWDGAFYALTGRHLFNQQELSKLNRYDFILSKAVIYIVLGLTILFLITFLVLTYRPG